MNIDCIRILQNIIYQDEQNGFYLIQSKYGEQFVNDQGIFIIEQIKRDNNIDRLADKFSVKYNLTKEKSMSYIYDFLSELKFLDIIDFNEKFFDSFVEQNEFDVAGERTYTIIANEITKKLGNKDKTIYTISPKTVYFNEYSLRMRGFHNQENYFFTKSGDAVDCIIGIQNLHNHSQPLKICLLQDADGNIDRLSTLYHNVEKKLCQLNQNKIKIVIQEETLDTRLMEFIEKNGYLFEARLLKEDNLYNYISYYKLMEDQNYVCS